MNWIAIVCAALAYWILGFLWYSVLFGKMWASGLEQRGLKMNANGAMAPKLIGTFIANFVAAVIMAKLVERMGTADVMHGLRLGAGMGVGFSASALTIQFLWQSMPFKVWLVDTS